MLKGTHCHNLKGKVFEINRQEFHGTQYLIIYEGVTDDVVVTYLPSLWIGVLSSGGGRDLLGPCIYRYKASHCNDDHNIVSTESIPASHS